MIKKAGSLNKIEMKNAKGGLNSILQTLYLKATSLQTPEDFSTLLHSLQTHLWVIMCMRAKAKLM